MYSFTESDYPTGKKSLGVMVVKNSIILFLTIAFLLCLSLSVSAEGIVHADLVIENANIFTVDKKNEHAEAIAVKNGRYVYVGDREGVEPFKGPKTTVWSLDNQLMLPGFIDGHTHAYLKAEEMFSLDLRPYSTIEEYKRAVHQYVKEHPHIKQLRAFGWNESVTLDAVESTGLTPIELADELVMGIPFVAQSFEEQKVWVNTEAIELAGIDNKTMYEHGVIEKDKETQKVSGIIRGLPMRTILQSLPQPDFTVEQYKMALLRYQEEAAVNGITAAFVPLHDNSENLLQAFKELDEERKLTLTYALGLYVDMSKGLEQIETLKQLKEKYEGKNFYMNMVKVFGTVPMDNSEEDFAWNQKKFNNIIAKLDEEGFRIHVHANGPDLDEIFAGFEYAKEKNGNWDFRHTITHIPFVKNQDLVKFRKLKMIPSVQPGTFYHTFSVKEDDIRLKTLNRMRSYFEKGLPVASSSNYPMNEMNPLFGIETGMTRLHPEETDEEITPLWPREKAILRQMIRSYTLYPARQMGIEQHIGNIRVGKQADFIVLNENIFKIPPSEISETKVILTYFKGIEVYRDINLVKEKNLSID